MVSSNIVMVLLCASNCELWPHHFIAKLPFAKCKLVLHKNVLQVSWKPIKHAERATTDGRVFFMYRSTLITFYCTFFSSIHAQLLLITSQQIKFHSILPRNLLIPFRGVRILWTSFIIVNQTSTQFFENFFSIESCKMWA